MCVCMYVYLTVYVYVCMYVSLYIEEEEGEGDRKRQEEEILKEKQRKKHRKLKQIKKKLRKQIEHNQMKKNKFFKGKPVSMIEKNDEYKEATHNIHSIFHKESRNINVMNPNELTLDDIDSDDDDDSDNNNDEDNDNLTVGRRKNKSKSSSLDLQAMGAGLDHEMKELEAKGKLLMSDTDRLRRQDISMTRIPFDYRINYLWIYSFAAVMLFIFIGSLLYKASTTSYYVLNEKVEPFNSYTSNISISSLFVNLIAILCDFKELYHTLRNIVPIKPSWIPLITVDSSEGVNSMFIGQAVIPLANISKIERVSNPHTGLLVIGIFLGSLPICILTLVLRDQYLNYFDMRIVVPFLGALILYRALLGPTVLIKMAHTLYYMFSYSLEIREQIGKACMATKTTNAALVGAFSISIISLFFFAGINVSYVGPAFGILFFFGFLYGSITVASHELPIKPWIHLTVFPGFHIPGVCTGIGQISYKSVNNGNGVCIHLQRKQKCPCVLWYKWCTEMHLMDEVFIAYTKDDEQFINYMRKVTGVGGGYEMSIANDDS